MTRIPRLFCLVSAADDLTLLPALAAAGVDGFQVRDKAATTRELLALTERVLTATAGLTTVIVDDRIDVALAAGAHGVHLGADDLPVAAARRQGPHLIIGATCRDRDQVRAASSTGADYAGFGPLFVTSSKAGLPDPLGVGALTDAVGILPLIGISGIDAVRAAQAREAGAHGVAVIGGLWRQPDPVAAARDLVKAVR